NIMRDNSIVNISGAFMAIDLNIEHLIGYTKKLHLLKGIHSSSEHLANISACIKVLLSLKKRIGSKLDTAYHGKRHTTPDTSKLVWRVFDDLAATKVQIATPGREANLLVKPFVDLLSMGHHQLVSASLKKFNEKMHAFKQGAAFEVEVDEMPIAEFTNVMGDDDAEE
ncbi:hypothetical protein C8J56DRAFT_794819, partial [Mycena floridula]